MTIKDINFAAFLFISNLFTLQQSRSYASVPLFFFKKLSTYNVTIIILNTYLKSISKLSYEIYFLSLCIVHYKIIVVAISNDNYNNVLYFNQIDTIQKYSEVHLINIRTSFLMFFI